MIPNRDRSMLAPLLGQTVTASATYTAKVRQVSPHPALHLIHGVRIYDRDTYVPHLWVTLPRWPKLRDGQRFRFEGVVIAYTRSDGMSDSHTIARITLL